MKIKNRVTGDVIDLPDDPGARSLYLFKLACKALDRLAHVFDLHLYFLTITLSGNNVDKLNKDLNKFLNFMRARFKRAGLVWFYVWVVELQKKRFYRSGVKALHWHFAIICRNSALPHVLFNQNARRKYLVLEEGTVVTTRELFKAWGYGQVFCKQGWSRGVYDYLSKYFTKDYDSLEGYNPEWSKLRRFGSSQLGYYKLPLWAYERVNQLYEERPLLRRCVVRRQAGRICFYRHEEPGEYVLEYSEASPWELVR